MAEYTTGVATNFKVEIDGLDFGNFISVTGLGGTADIADDIGGMDKNARKVPGKVKYETVVMTRNWDPTNRLLRDWWATVEKADKEPERKSVSIVYFDRNGTNEVARRNLYECIPCGWDSSDLSSNDHSVITEEISIVYEDADWA